MAADIKIQTRRKLLDETVGPKFVNRFQFSAVNEQVQLDAGYVEIAALREAIEAGKAERPVEPVDFFVVDRFVLSAEAVLELHRTVGDMVKHLQTIGKVPVNDGSEPSN